MHLSKNNGEWENKVEKYFFVVSVNSPTRMMMNKSIHSLGGAPHTKLSKKKIARRAEFEIQNLPEID
jgi:hypothetical protein